MRGSDLLIPALVLGCFAMLGSALVSYIHAATAEQIGENQQRVLQRELDALIPVLSRDNDLLQDVLEIEAPGAAAGRKIRVYRARRHGAPVAAVFSPVIARGYAGPIELMVAVQHDGRLAGVRVMQHKETPGLGDKIELERAPWILGFNGRSLTDPPERGWRVKRDGGEFDQFTGATVTPRGVVSAVFSILKFFQRHRAQLFAQAAGAAVGFPAATRLA